MVIRRDVPVFLSGFCISVRMYAPAKQPPDFHYNVNDNRQKLTVWVGLCGNGDILDLSSLTKALTEKVV